MECMSVSTPLQQRRPHLRLLSPTASGGSCRHRCPAAAGAWQRRVPPCAREWHSQTRRLVAVASAVAEGRNDGAQSSSGSSTAAGLQAAKERLLAAVAGTDRGGEAGSMQRGQVEEAQVGVEAFSCCELDFDRLEGKWLLKYTTARDVLPLVSPQRLPAPLQVGRIYQRFSSVAEGRVQNIIEASLPLPLVDGGSGSGVSFVVEAGYEIRTAKSIALTFRAAGFEEVVMSPGLQNLLASPLLPRGWWNQQLLMGLKELSLRVPLTTRLPSSTSQAQLPVGINYMLTFLDEDMLIGRAQGNGGTFIFTREQQQVEQAAKQG